MEDWKLEKGILSVKGEETRNSKVVISNSVILWCTSEVVIVVVVLLAVLNYTKKVNKL